MNNDFNSNEYIATPDQLSYARSSVLDDGPGRGQRIIDIVNGYGLSCTVTPDRGLNIVECSFLGIPLVYRTPVGHQRATGNFQEDWVAGLLTTCGLHNIGVASMGEPKHGRISQLAANHVAISREGKDLLVHGELREGWLFGPNLRLVRVIRVSTETNTISLEDIVTNLAPQADDISILYHSNFGYPLITPETILEAPPHTVEPRDKTAAKGLSSWNRMDPPVPNYQEQCFLHKLIADENGMAGMRIVNRKLGIAVRVDYDTATIRQMVQWKNCMTGNYILGLEPAVGSLMGREADLKNHELHHLESGESVAFNIQYKFEKIS